MPYAVSEESEEDEHGVLPPVRETIDDRIRSLDAFHEAFFLHLIEAAGENPRGQPGIVAEDLSESVQFQEGHVTQDEQGPLATESLHALADWVRLICQERGARPRSAGSAPTPTSRHSPSAPQHPYLRSNAQRLCPARCDADDDGDTSCLD